jgi:hypothetical protein
MVPTYFKLLSIGFLFAFGMGTHDCNSQSPQKKALKPDTTQRDKTSVRNQHAIKNNDTITNRTRPKKKGQEKSKMYLAPDSTREKSKKSTIKP